MKSYGSGLLVMLIVALMSACGGSDSPPQAPRSADPPAITGQPAGFDADDLAFANAMIELYHQSTGLTELVPEHSTDPNLVAIAADISAAQGPDLETMKVFLVQWNENADGNSGQGGRANPVLGVIDDATMGRLNALRGRDFDTLWLRSMIRHQQEAAAMAQNEVANGANVDAVATARQLIGTYQAQIARMQLALEGG